MINESVLYSEYSGSNSVFPALLLVQAIFLQAVNNCSSFQIQLIIFFSARERAEFIKSCNLIGSWSGRNPSCWSIFVNELAVTVDISLFLHFHRRLINAGLSLFTFKWQGKSL